MQPTLCSRCKKNVAVVFISRLNEKNEQVNEGLCLKCAAQLGLPQVDEMMKRMGITPEDLDSISNEMMQAFGGAEELPEGPEDGEEDDEESGKTATFPFLNRLFGNGGTPAQPQQGAENGGAPHNGGRKTEKKRKFLDNYCINLSQRARQGKLDAVIGREQEIERVVQILNRRQKNNPCLIGEPGVGKTAIAEGLAQRIAAGQVPFKLRDKEVYLLDLTALVAGTQFRGQFESRMKGLIEEIRKAGIHVDEESKTTMEHLYAIGETACNGVHGRNRLASNSLLESLVFAKRAALHILENYEPLNEELPTVDYSAYEPAEELAQKRKERILAEIERLNNNGNQ